MPAPPRRATYRPAGRTEASSEGARYGRGYGFGKTYAKQPNFLERLMAYARARASQVFIGPGPGQLGPSFRAAGRGRVAIQTRPTQAGFQAQRAGIAAARAGAYAGRSPLYTKRKPATFQRTPFEQEPSPYLQRAPVTGGYSPASARALYYNQFPVPGVLPGSEGAGAGGAPPYYPGYGGYGGYGGGGGAGAGYRGPAFYGQEQAPRYPTYLRPEIPRWLQSLVTWNIRG
jgi:hypothetical protein